jgi:hypothetical protein
VIAAHGLRPGHHQRTVAVSTKARGRFTLGVPNASGHYRNPLFDQQPAQITACWRASI